MIKIILSKTLKVVLLGLIFYYPFQIAKYFLTDLTYAEISDYYWRKDRGDCSGRCLGGIHNFRGECWIDNDGYLNYYQTPVGQVIAMKKPSYIETDIITGGTLKILSFENGGICEYDSIGD